MTHIPPCSTEMGRPLKLRFRYSFNRFRAAADGLLRDMEEDITLMHRITRKGEVIQTGDIIIMVYDSIC